VQTNKQDGILIGRHIKERKKDTSRHLQDRQTYKQNERQREIQSDEKTDTTDRRDDQMDA
jgi:hypothetical protein